MKRIVMGFEAGALVILRIFGVIPRLDPSKNEILSITNPPPATDDEADEALRNHRGCILRRTPNQP